MGIIRFISKLTKRKNALANIGLLVVLFDMQPVFALIDTDPQFNSLSIAEGLPTNRVEDIIQDRLGYVWIATANGLVRHDGHELRVLRHNPLNPESLPGNNIQAIHAAQSGSVWIAISGQGVFELRGLKIVNRWPSIERGGPLRSGYIWSIAEDCDGDIWLMFSTGGLAKINTDTGQIELVNIGMHGLAERSIQMELIVDSQCRFWLLNSDRLLLSAAHDSPDFYTFLDFDKTPINQGVAIHETPNGEVFVAGSNGVLQLELPAANREPMLLNRLDELWTETETIAFDVVSADDQHLWVGMVDGVGRLNFVTRELRHFGQRNTQGAGAVLADAQDLLVDQEGSLWISGFRRGVWRLPSMWPAFRKLIFSSLEDAEFTNEILPITAVSDGNGLVYANANGDIHATNLDLLIADNAVDTQFISSVDNYSGSGGLIADSNWVWFHSQEQLIRIDRASGQQEVVRTFEFGQNIRFLDSAENGNFWLGSIDNSLELVDSSGTSVQRWYPEGSGKHRLQAGVTVSVQRGFDGHWWLLSQHSIHRLSDDGIFERIFHRPELAQNAMVMQGNSVWLAGNSFLEQLVLQGGELQSKRRFYASDGLPALPILHLFAQSDSIWLLLESGFAQFDLTTDRFRVFTSRDGLPTSRFRRYASLMLGDGRIVAGTEDGLLVIDPAMIRTRDQAPPVYISSVRAGDQLIDIDPLADHVIDLDWRNNSLEFNFVALSYLNPDANASRMRLLGWDDDWYVQTGQNRRYYSNLPPGSYRFELQAASADGVWSDQGAEVSVTIAPPPWLSSWAVLAYVAFALVTVMLLWRVLAAQRQRRYEMFRAQEQQALARSQRNFLQVLNQNLEPEYLAKTIGQSVLKLLKLNKAWFAYLAEDFPQKLFPLGDQHTELKISRDQFQQRLASHHALDMIRLQSDDQTLAAIWLPDLTDSVDPQLRSELDLLTQSAAQVIQNAALLISIRQYGEQADRANRAKSDFLATMSHEIRTPLHGLLGMIDLLSGESLAPQHFEMLRTMRASGHQLQRILNDILDLSRIEANRIHLHNEPFELIELLEQAVDLHAANASVSGLDLRLQMASDLPLIAVGDADRIAQVVGNLLSNAIKFTDHGVVELQSWLSQDGYLNLTVSDTGPGIESSSQTMLFQPFTQLESSGTRRHSGTGLGLAICRRMVDEMGGRIDLQSRVGHGSRFTLRLPLDGMQRQAPRAIQLLKDYRLGVAVSVPYARILLRMCRRWSLSFVHAQSQPDRLDAVIIEAGFYDREQLRTWLQSGVPVWQLSGPARDSEPLEQGVQSLRLPLITSRLMAALLDRSLRSEP